MHSLWLSPCAFSCLPSSLVSVNQPLFTGTPLSQKSSTSPWLALSSLLPQHLVQEFSLQPPRMPWLNPISLLHPLCNSCKSVLTCLWRGADSYSFLKNCLPLTWCLVPSRNAVKICELEDITVLTNPCVRALCAQIHDTFLLTKAFVLKPGGV